MSTPSNPEKVNRKTPLEQSKLIYILAASHSGSTLTAMLLGAHPQVSCVGELKANHLGDISNYLCSCQQKITDCEFWESITSRMSILGEEFSITHSQTDIYSVASPYESRLLRPLIRNRFWEFFRDIALGVSSGWRQKLGRIQRRNNLLIRSIIAETDTEMIVDSSKIGIRLKYLLRNPALDIKVIWLVRDGRGVSLAYLNPSEYADAKNERMRGGGTGKTQEPSRDIRQGAYEWRRCNEEARNILATMHKDRWMKIHYEDICENTESTLDRIFNFVGLDASRKVLDYRSDEHHMVGNGMRLDSDTTIKLDDRWMHELDAEHIRQFNIIAGDLNKSLGYPA